MLELLTSIGGILSMSVIALVWAFLMMLRITWTCGLCGKTVDGNIFQFLLQMCDHGGMFN